MKITITIPDAVYPRVVNALSVLYQPQIMDEQGLPVQNPQTREQFAREQLLVSIKNAVKTYEGYRAQEAARVAAIEAAESEIKIS